MTHYRSIEVDFEIHQMIEMERRSFSETPNVALRRLLKLDGSSSASPTDSSEGTPWLGKGVSLRHGTELRMEYNSRRYTGHIANGAWVVEGQRFTTPSAAASRVAVTKDGKHTQLDGWNYWYVKRPGDTEWRALKQLRPPQTP